MKRALICFVLAGIATISVAQAIDDEGSGSDVSVLNFDWKYAGYQRAETVAENEAGKSTDPSTRYKVSRKTVYVFKYVAKATLENRGAKTIKAVAWDYVFTEAESQKELKRYKFQSKEQILPGASQTLSKDVGVDPKESTRHITTGKQSVEIARIEYTDGSVWRLQ